MNIYNLYLPKRIAWQVKIIVGCALTAVMFNWFQSGQAFNERFWYLFAIVLLQVEFAMWVSMKIFGSEPDVVTKSYEKTTVKKLLIVYAIVLGMAGMIFIFMVFVEIIINEADLGEVFAYMSGTGLKSLIISASVGLLIGAVIFFYSQWLDALKREQKLKEEKLIFQYETLKNQVNPHFLFNSLNTLSSLVYKDPKQSDEFIKKLSIIYRYILENSDKESVELNSEIGFVQDFFYLQEIRDNGKIKLNIKLNNPDTYRILPISLQLLVENALKHNASTRDKPLKIDIKTENEKVIISNNLQPKQNIEDSSKIGLKNLGERIKLMTGKEIEISETNDQFIVKLPLIRV
ncbi:sensor histidine kinase [Bacteroidota bacterium]